MSNFVFEIDIKGKIIYANAAAKDTFDLKSVSNFYSLISKKQKDKLDKTILKSKNDNRSIESELNIIPTNSNWLCQVYYYSNDSINIICAKERPNQSIIDILLDNEEKYRMLFDNMINAFALHEIILNDEEEPIDYRFLEANTTFEKLTGLKRDEIIGKKVTEVIPNLEPKWINIYGEIALNGGSKQFEEYSSNLKRHYLISVFSPEKHQFVTTFIDITKFVQTEKALKQNESLYRTLFDNSPLGICTFKKNGTIVDFNHEFINILGLNSFKAVKKGKLYDYQPFQQKTIINQCKTCFTEGKRYIGAKEYKSDTGDKIFLKYILSPLFDENKKVYLTQALIEDNTKQKQFEDELIKAKDKAEESDHLKSVFLSNISHEIRTPMNAILGFSSLLSKSSTNPERKDKYIEIITRNGKQLIGIIDDILDISQIELNQVPVDRQVFSLSELLSGLSIQYQKEILTRGKDNISIKLSCPENDPHDEIFTDKMKLSKVFHYLLDNSFKFTFFGHVEFGYFIEKDQYHFFIKDTGIGIEKNKQQLVFERFRQEDESTSKQFGGTGLGLSISKELITLLGGNLWLSSVKGKGTQIAFTLPFELPAEKAEPVPSIETINKTYNFTGKKILIAEDDINSYEYFKELLDETKVELIHAKNGQEALDIFNLSTNSLDLVLLDIQMPIINGLDVAKKIRSSNKKIPIVAQTAYALQEEEEKCYKAGCSDYITKPVDSSTLLEKLNFHLIPDKKREKA